MASYDTDLEFAMKLQAEENAGIRQDSAESSCAYGSSSSQRNLSADEELARQLQEEFDRMEIDEPQDTIMKSDKKPSVAHDNDDEIFAMELQQEFDTPLSSNSKGKQVAHPHYLSNKEVGSELSSRALHHALSKYIRTGCWRCGHKILATMDAVSRLFETWMRYNGIASSSILCSGCAGNTCWGCGQQIDQNLSLLDLGATKLGWCCDDGRLFVIWVLLSGYDHKRSCDRHRDALAASASQHPARMPQGAGQGTRPSGTSYSGGGSPFLFNPGHPYFAAGPPSFSTGLSPFPATYTSYAYPPLHGSPFAPIQTGTGYGVRTSQVDAFHNENADRAAKSGAEEDKIVSQILILLAVLLPNIENQAHFDQIPPEVLVPMLRKSSFLDRVAELLVNDALEDITSRSRLYRNVLSFVQVLGNHYATLEPTIFRERDDKEIGENLLNFSFAKTIPPEKRREQSKAIATCLKNLCVQSSLYLRTVQQVTGDVDTQNTLSICKEIIGLATHLLVNSEKALGKSNDTLSWSDWQKDNGFTDAPDRAILEQHHYARDAKKLQGAHKNRMRQLTLELTRLKTGLPPGIFVRHGVSRIDVMKVLIIGPKDTPYEGGLFEFDLFCDDKYPFEPPKMNFKTTGGGLLSFNPNLYPSGKVCLSLLGTWAGEQWRPGQSTILQVLVSLQAMVFCDEPYCNEPGRDHLQGTEASKAANKKYQAMTIKHAMIDWLREGYDPLWGDIVREHFLRNGDQIAQTIGIWASDRTTYPGGQRFTTHGTRRERPVSSSSLLKLKGVFQTELAAFKNKLKHLGRETI